MAVEWPTRPPHFVDRTRIAVVLAAPFVVLVLATLSAWPWRALELPGVIGTLTPPGIFLMALVVAGAMYALQRRLPLGMITWVPAGQGAIVLLTTSFVADATEPLVGVAIIMVYVLIYLIVLGLAMVVAGTSTPLSISFVAFFVLTQATRFPLFGDDVQDPVGGSAALTVVVFLVALGEVVLLAWLVRRLLEAPAEEESRVTWLIVAFVFAHGLIAGWEEPLLRGELSFVGFIEQFFRWFILAGIQMGMAWGLLRLRNSWSSEPRWAESQPEKSPKAPKEKKDDVPAEATIMDAPEPRRRRRR
ncbi:MAG: hypothetical protein O3B65_03105 [Chloroflexi bacterium]|nr:hypothetical protein [Chloroflexota bacterium]